MAKDWGAEAIKAATYIGEHLGEAHRGALVWEPGVVAIFGNDSYNGDGRAKQEVAYVREHLADAGVTELGFGTDAEFGEDWVLLVRVPGPEAATPAGSRFQRTLVSERLSDLAWDGWDAACRVRAEDPLHGVYRAVQEPIARRVLDAAAAKGR
jgi:hypothetical protein